MKTDYVSELVFLTNNSSCSCWFDRCSDCSCDSDCRRDCSCDTECYCDSECYCDNDWDRCPSDDYDGCDYCSCEDY